MTSRSSSTWVNSFIEEWKTGTGPTAPVLEPATGQILVQVAESLPADVSRAASLASSVQSAWASVSYEERASVLRRVADLIQLHSDEIATWNIRETGAVRGKADNEVYNTLNEVLNAATMPAQPLGSLMPSADPARMSLVRRVPIGVVGAITPWNFPLVLGMRVVAPAIALGNSVVIKPDPQTPVSGGAIIAALFAQAGLPEGVLQVVCGGADVGEALVSDPQVSMVSFTGSTRTGRRVAQLAAASLKKTSLELGGNNAFIVLDDADVDVASSAGAWGSFLHQGQICLTAGRHLVHERIAQEYTEALARRARALTVGDPFVADVHLGPIINQRQLAHLDDLVTRSIAGGAVLAEGGTHEGLFYRPTVLGSVSRDLPAFTDEIFGPVAPVTTFASDDEAVALANMTGYGLVAGVHTRSLSRGLAIANRIKSGMVHVNDQTVNDEAIVPFGGMGSSGNGGRYGGSANFEEFTQWQWVTIRDVPPSYPF